jgi:hypothetical protein
MSDPSEKYVDRVSPEHRAAMEIVTSSYHMMRLVESQLRRLDNAEQQSHSIGHILDPTLYRDQINSKSFVMQMKVVRAALAFIDSVREAVRDGS